MDKNTTTGLAETIQALRTELVTAMESGKEDPLHFQLGPVQLDVTLAITREGGGEGGIRFWILSMGAKGSVGDVTTHRLSLSLQPIVAGVSGVTKPAEISSKTSREPK
jgi:Trypsin-co-occurring domain 2